MMTKLFSKPAAMIQAQPKPINDVFVVKPMYVLLVPVFMLFSLVTQAQRNGIFYDEMPTPIGARALGLGGAYTALVNDASATYWNPGALGLIEGLSITANWNVSTRFASIEADAASGVNVTTSVNGAVPYVGLNEISLAYPIELFDYDVRFVPAISYRQVSNYRFLKENWQMRYTASSETLDYEIEYDHSGGMNALSLGFGLSISEYLGLGLVYNIYTGSREENVNLDLSSNFGVNDQFSSTTATRFRGGGLVVGLKASTNPLDDAVYAPGDDYELGMDVGISLSLPHQRRQFSDFSNSFIDTITFFYNQPMLFRTGVAYRFPEVMLSFDYTYSNLSSGRRMASHQFNSGFAFDEGVDLYSLAIGVEFSHMYRLGFFSRNYQFKADAGESNETYGLSGGLSVGDDETFIFDLSLMLEFFDWNINEIGGLGDNIRYTGSNFTIMAGFRIFLN
jgi:hypothetical protein